VNNGCGRHCDCKVPEGIVTFCDQEKWREISVISSYEAGDFNRQFQNTNNKAYL
jgi:hypothetical protein